MLALDCRSWPMDRHHIGHQEQAARAAGEDHEHECLWHSHIFLNRESRPLRNSSFSIFFPNVLCSKKQIVQVVQRNFQFVWEIMHGVKSVMVETKKDEPLHFDVIHRKTLKTFFESKINWVCGIFSCHNYYYDEIQWLESFWASFKKRK